MKYGMRGVVLLLAVSWAVGMASQASANPAPPPPPPGVAATKYDEVKKFLRGVEAQFPQNAKLISIGLSDSGEQIEGLQIGNGAIKNLVVGTHHGNEYGSTEVAKAFARSVAETPLVGQTLFVIPVLNIKGYNSGIRWETGGGTNHDPNRDYPGPCGTEGPFKLKSTAALAKFIDEQGIVGSATLHTYSPAVLYPWGISTHDLATPYDPLFKQLVADATVESHYTVGNSTAVLYAADGTFEDYAFWKHGVWSILFELGYSHSPGNLDVQQMIKVNVPGMRRMFDQVPSARAENHAFTGKCDVRLKSLDRHDE
ncbi:M14 family metallopeptidase [Bdellovibrionota bacterium FG-2]